MSRALRAEVVGYSITPAGVVLVTVRCPTCKVARGRSAGTPKTHTHGWSRPGGKDGGDRAAHCANLDAPPYSLYWPGGAPVDVVAALEGRLAHAG